MKTCKRCFEDYDEKATPDVSLATELADIFLREIGVDDISDICPQCREELGVMNMLGFSQQRSPSLNIFNAQTVLGDIDALTQCLNGDISFTLHPSRQQTHVSGSITLKGFLTPSTNFPVFNNRNFPSGISHFCILATV